MNRLLWTVNRATLAAVLVLTLAGASQMAVRADDGVEGHGKREHYEKVDIRRDEERLHRLERKIDEQMRCHDYSAARETRLAILDVRRDIERDRKQLERERRERDRDRDGDGYRHHE